MKVKSIARTTLVLMAAFGLASCPDDGPLEEAGEAVDDAADDVGDAVDDAVDDIDDLGD